WNLAFGKRMEEELYDVVTDPDCMNNLANDSQYQSLKKSMKTLLFKGLEAQEDPRVLGDGDVFDNYLYSNEKHRNFYDRYTTDKIPWSHAAWVNKDDFESTTIEQ
ncbi:MAG: heparan N-sulfatase, partial [Bacteroidota bacterium]